jgi:EmrB/QacA subfamily drug resistance transporter
MPNASARVANPTIIAYIAAAAFFMEALDSTIIATALPPMAASFHTAPVALGLGVTAYMLSVAIMIPASGWIADRFGARTVFCSAIAIFTLSSMLCGMSNNLPQFVGARILQGVGAAMMTPVGRLILLRLTPKENLVRAINTMTIPALIGPTLGPALGGLLATYFTWRWIFFINAPIGVLGMALVLRFVPNDRSPERRPFDVQGFALNAGALGLILYGMDALGDAGGPGWKAGAAMIAAGLVLGAFAIRHLWTAAHPLISLGATRVKTFMFATGWAGSFFRMGLMAPMFVMPLLLQLGLGMSPFASGMMILVCTGADLSAKFGVQRGLRAIGFRQVLLWTCPVYVASMFVWAVFDAHTPVWVMLAALIVAGATRSLHMTAINGLQFADVPAEETTGASTLASVIMPINRAFGVALAVLILNAAIALTHGRPGFPSLVDLRVGVLATSGMAFLALFWSLRLPKDAGSHVSGHAAPAPAKPAAQGA